MNSIVPQSGSTGIYYRLITLWVLCEAMLGGIIHGFKIPVSGLVVGSCAVICICLIAWYVPGKAVILKATLIVAIFKMTLSPQAPFPAYIALFFQGIMGELLFFNRRFYRISCMLLAILALLESGLQRILVLTIVYGNDLWVVINDFINGLTKQKNTTNYSLWIGAGYTGLHVLTGVFVGRWAALLPRRVEKWQAEEQYKIILQSRPGTQEVSGRKKRKRKKIGLFIIWIALVALYIQSYFNIGKPLLPAHISMKILVRSLIIVLTWIVLVGPLLKQVLHNWLQRKKSSWQGEVKEVFQLLPVLQQVLEESRKKSSVLKGTKRINAFSKMVLANVLRPNRENFNNANTCRVFIYTGPVHSGKTTALQKWAGEREDVWGIFTPVLDGQRFFLDVSSHLKFPMEAVTGEAEVLKIGPFVFSKRQFKKAEEILFQHLQKPGWLILDEIGPLELKGEGFHDILKSILNERKDNILLVVRQGIAEQVKDYFNIREAVLITDVSGLNS